MTKKTILFDATIFRQAMSGNGTGIYYTALHILKEMMKDERIDICFYLKKDSPAYAIMKEMFSADISFYYSIPEFISSALKKNKERQIKAKEEKKTRFWINLEHLFLKAIFSFVVRRNKTLKYDVFFSPVFEVPAEIKRNKRIKKFVFLYDTLPILFPQYFNGVAWYHRLVKSLNKQDYYFADSQSAKDDFLKACPVLSADQIKVALLAADERFKPASAEEIARVKAKYGIPADKKYVFSLCSLDPRKNLIRASKTFVEFINKNHLTDIVFAMGGGGLHHFIPVLEAELKKLGADAEKILKLGRIDDEDVAALYSGAEWFVYTSQYEGFGLPPLEAMSCGCPVITSNNSSLPEVVGEAGVMIDWDSDEQHIKAYEDYYFNEKLRSEAAEKGLERARQFSWKKTANIIIEEFLK